jgi:tetratricopeptide (TPR) repeat protein
MRWEGYVQDVEAIAGGREELEEYRRLLVRDPNSLRFAEYADRLRRFGQLEDALAICQHGLARQPAYSTGRVVMGEILIDSGKAQEAEAEWRRALQLDPGHPRALLRLGELYLSRGETDHAIAAFETALLHSPEFPEARAKLAEVKGPSPTLRIGEPKPLEDRLRTAGARPEWLTADRFDDLVQRVAACPSVEAAALVDSSGSQVSGDLPETVGGPTGEAPMSFLAEARSLLSRLGAGRLRSALICSNTLSLRCVPLGDLALLAALRSRSPVGEADEQIEECIAGGERSEENEADADE